MDDPTIEQRVLDHLESLGADYTAVRIDPAYANTALETGHGVGAELAVRVATDLAGEIAARAPGTPQMEAADPRWGPITALIDQAGVRLEKWRGPAWRRRRDGPDEE